MAIFQSIPILAGRLLQDREHTLLKVHAANNLCRSGRPKSLIDPRKPPTIAQDAVILHNFADTVRLERFSEPPTSETDVRYASESIFPILAGLAAGPILQSIAQYLQGNEPISNINTCRDPKQYFHQALDSHDSPQVDFNLLAGPRVKSEDSDC